VTVDIPLLAIQSASALVAIGATVFYFQYRASIKRHTERLKQKLARGLVYREVDNKNNKISMTTTPSMAADSSKVIKALELNSAFVQEHASSWQLCSLGEYLSTLRLFTDNNKGDNNNNNNNNNGDNKIKKLLENELYVVMASLLMKTFGESVGAALLPMMGTEKVESMMGTVASKVVSYIIAKILVDRQSKDEDVWDPMQDMAAMPLNVSEIIR